MGDKIEKNEMAGDIVLCGMGAACTGARHVQGRGIYMGKACTGERPVQSRPCRS